VLASVEHAAVILGAVHAESAGSPGPSDAELAGRAARGDEAAFGLLYERHRDWVFALALRVTGRREDALDVTQDVFVELLGRLPGWNVAGSLRPLLRPMVRNKAIDRARRAGREVRAEEAVPEPAAPGHATEDGGELARVLRALPAEQREALLLRYVDGLELAEIAAAMGVPLGTVKSRLHQAVEHLRRDPRVAQHFGREG
jgi:RNA polymerase sigma-70 factor (ECF subfamily)